MGEARAAPPFRWVWFRGSRFGLPGTARREGRIRSMIPRSRRVPKEDSWILCGGSSNSSIGTSRSPAAAC
ncbi:hypothetical protein ACFFX0_03540 [Citricoccus parietis]|uniref:Uncharacterized protein n=1 Tax=Citricoccus parietis TaxID=592307 RepID=A0ABV5FUG5_9MICC